MSPATRNFTLPAPNEDLSFTHTTHYALSIIDTTRHVWIVDGWSILCAGATQNILDTRSGNGQRELEEERAKTLMPTKESSGQASNIGIRSIEHETRELFCETSGVKYNLEADLIAGYFHHPRPQSLLIGRTWLVVEVCTSSSFKARVTRSDDPSIPLPEAVASITARICESIGHKKPISEGYLYTWSIHIGVFIAVPSAETHLSRTWSKGITESDNTAIFNSHWNPR
jgi:hypothetical protein